jgi:hypothetical protein
VLLDDLLPRSVAELGRALRRADDVGEQHGGEHPIERRVLFLDRLSESPDRLRDLPDVAEVHVVPVPRHSDELRARDLVRGPPRLLHVGVDPSGSHHHGSWHLDQREHAPRIGREPHTTEPRQVAGCRQPYILAGDAEALVEDLYRRVQLPESWVDRLTEELEGEIVERQAEASERRVVLTKTLSRLAEERGKLLQAFYANAIPLELLKAEQDRIGVAEQAARAELEAAEGDLEGWQDVLRTAIRLAGNCHAAYLKARPSIRRRFNDAVLEAVYIKDRRIGRAEFSDVFAPLFSRPSSNKALKVDLAGRCVNRLPLLQALQNQAAA